jgi:hypothetical protein
VAGHGGTPDFQAVQAADSCQVGLVDFRDDQTFGLGADLAFEGVGDVNGGQR